MKQGLVLDKVVLLGRTLDEYRRSFALDPAAWRGRVVLDVAAGVGSFCAEANALGVRVTAFDAIYDWPAEDIQKRCGPDLDQVVRAMEGLKTYRWGFYESPGKMRVYRERAYRTFLEDYRRQGRERYIAGRLPRLPFADRQFDLTLVSYLMFVYEDQFDYEFHKQSVLELMRVTAGEARIYPLVTFEAKRSQYLDRLQADADLRHIRFEEVQTDFEFLANSNWYLSLRRRD